MSEDQKSTGGADGQRIKQIRKSIGFSPILVPVDFSENSLIALVYAAKLARRLEADLFVLHVVHDPPESPGFYADVQAHHIPGSVVDIESAAWSMLQEFVERSRVRKKVRVKLLCEPGIPPSRIVEIARSRHVQLIVMATHAGALRRLFIGSTAEQVARSAECPVLFARAVSFGLGDDEPSQPDPVPAM